MPRATSGYVDWGEDHPGWWLAYCEQTSDFRWALRLLGIMWQGAAYPSSVVGSLADFNLTLATYAAQLGDRRQYPGWPRCGRRAGERYDRDVRDCVMPTTVVHYLQGGDHGQD